jgi:hypothetical protein
VWIPFSYCWIRHGGGQKRCWLHLQQRRGPNATLPLYTQLQYIGQPRLGLSHFQYESLEYRFHIAGCDLGEDKKEAGSTFNEGEVRIPTSFLLLCYSWALSWVIRKPMSLEYEPSLESEHTLLLSTELEQISKSRPDHDDLDSGHFQYERLEKRLNGCLFDQ